MTTLKDVSISYRLNQPIFGFDELQEKFKDKLNPSSEENTIQKAIE